MRKRKEVQWWVRIKKNYKNWTLVNNLPILLRQIWSQPVVCGKNIVLLNTVSLNYSVVQTLYDNILGMPKFENKNECSRAFIRHVSGNLPRLIIEWISWKEGGGRTTKNKIDILDPAKVKYSEKRNRLERQLFTILITRVPDTWLRL